MSAEVEDQLIKFIGRFYTRDLSLTWFGGEPLLAFDRILSIDRRVRELGKRVSASIDSFAGFDASGFDGGFDGGFDAGGFDGGFDDGGFDGGGDE